MVKYACKICLINFNMLSSKLIENKFRNKPHIIKYSFHFSVFNYPCKNIIHNTLVCILEYACADAVSLYLLK